jgi:5-methylcytosine-specific restriction endonuclease McrA
MASEFYRSYLASTAWQSKRQQRLQWDRYRCQGCGTSKRLDVHHRTYARLGHEYLADLQTLCRPCHDRVHAKSSRFDTVLATIFWVTLVEIVVLICWRVFVR